MFNVYLRNCTAYINVIDALCVCGPNKPQSYFQISVPGVLFRYLDETGIGLFKLLLAHVSINLKQIRCVSTLWWKDWGSIALAKHFTTCVTTSEFVFFTCSF